MITPVTAINLEFQTLERNLMVWKMIAPRTAAERMHLAFPHMQYFNEEILQHENGYLKPISDLELGQWMMNISPNTSSISPKWIADTLSLFKTLISVTEIPHIAGGVPFKNIILPNSDGKAFRQTHNLTYLPNADLPIVFKEYMEKLVPEAAKREKVYAYLCYLLHQNKDIQQMLILVGEKKVGKSTLLELIAQSIISLAGMQYEHINKDRASQVGMLDKFAIIFDEITDLKLNSSMGNQLKDWTTARTMTVRSMYKSVEDKLPFYGRFVLSCNTLPYSEYVESAFYDRICLIECKKSYVGGPNPDFVNAILACKNEIFSWIYDHYKDTYVNILGVRSNLTKEEYMCNIDAVSAFLEEIEPSDIQSVEFNELYKSYLGHAGVDAISKVEFGRRLQKKGYRSGRKDGKTVYYVNFVGVD